MKQIFAIVMIILFSNVTQAQDNSYVDLWKKVEQFENNGLPKSALEIVSQIATKAEIDKNVPLQIKTLLFKSKYALILEEDAQLKIIINFKDQIAKSTFPTKHILESVLANLYWQYFQQNRWKFYNRTTTANKIDTEDFRTWDIQTLFSEIHTHYQNSLQNGLLLQQESLSRFDAVLTLQKHSKTFRPTLFDFIAHNALEFYKTDENSITQPAYKFKIDNAKYLSDATTFSRLKIQSKDTSSLQLNALKLYQDLVQFHLKDKTPFALADIDIQRLLFVKQHATFSDKDTLFISALQTESERLSPHEVSGLYDFEIAKLYNQQGQSYKPITNETHRWKVKDAIALCNQIIAKFPKSKAAEKATILQQQVLHKSLELTSESHLPIAENGKLLVRYKNFEKLNFKVYQLSRSQYNNLNETHRKEEQIAFIKKLQIVSQWQSKLRNESDYQMHSTEVLLPELSSGYFVVFSSPQSENETTFAYASIQVTNLALVDKSDAKQHIYQVINRTNGKPIANANVTLNYIIRNIKERTEKGSTNSKGEIIIKKSSDRYRQLNVVVNHKTDIAYFDGYYLSRYYQEDDKDDIVYKSFLFTDRSIYRPGQTVYFKGIVMKTKTGKSEIISNTPVHAILYNVNGEELKKIELKTNEFGSIASEFVLPNGGLTGEYYINLIGKKNTFANNSYVYFSVEEYKRPKFETKFNPIKDTFKVNDSVIIKGNALAYAGSNITDAKVIYRVHRKVQYPRWYYWYRPQFISEPQEIAHGEGMTNDKGEFSITFKAIPDESVDKSNLPIFHFEVIADITDLNGETRSASTTVNVGYHALTASMTVDVNLDKTKKNHQLTIDTKNLNGEFAPAKGTIKIYKLIAPNNVLRTRPWPAPDYQEWTQNAFNKLFPHEAYSNEDNSNNWKKGKLVFDKEFNTELSKELALGKIKKWASGKYIFILETKDKFGQLVKDEVKTTLFSDADKTLSDNQLFSITVDKTEYKADDTVILRLATAGQITVSVDVEKDHKIINTYVIDLNNTIKTLNIPVTKNDVGGFVIHYSFAAFNSYRGGLVNINVPYPKTELEIETLTFRDKLQPGTDETWRFKIKGPKGDQIAAEILASMYDASLDQFKEHNWTFNPIQNPIYYSYNRRNAGRTFANSNFRIYNNNRTYHNYPIQGYDQFNWFGLHFGNSARSDKRFLMRSANIEVLEDSSEEIVASPMNIEAESSGLLGLVGGMEEDVPITEQKQPKKQTDFSGVTIRKNLQETAFFFPQLQTDTEGNVSFSFNTPEALTKWKLQLVAHSKTLESAVTTLETVTQKELMVIPNAPRFLREGDEITVSTKISNLTTNELSGVAVLQLFDALTGKSIDGELSNANNELEFIVKAEANSQVSWKLDIPDGIQAVQYKIIAKAGDFSDGEQNAIPVLTNRMLVTETMPMWIRSNQTKTFTLNKLKNVRSTTLKHHNLTLEMTSNPAWYAVQALPYLMEYPYECNEQTFSRYYANALANHIANSNPRIQEVFNQWKNTDALLSNLEKNQELKSLLIQETPWLRDAQSETEQKKRIALLFDLNKMNNELQSALRKLQSNQMSSGAWSWFNGGRANRYITQHIITGFGHLNKLDVSSSTVVTSMVSNAINYLDAQFIKEYKDLRKYDKDVDLSKDHFSYTQLHYLYMRSFFSEIPKSKELEDISKYYLSQIQNYWLSRSLYAKGLMALITGRMNDTKTSFKILKSLKETSITSEELGMYWKENSNSWYWYQAPIETQALLIEAFSEIENDTKTIDNLKIWLLKNKQTNRWKTTKATTVAVYALLLQGSDWLSVTEMVDVVLGGQQISPSKLENVKVEAGTGYYKTSWSSSEIKPEMANVTLTKKGNGVAWGSLYWQYFEDLDKITSAETPLQIKKKLFLKTNTDKGEEISEITNETNLKVGDLVRVRIELRSDRPMEFVHMKDMRAAGLEPINVLSQYKWQDGLGYYESTKDAATNFFFDYLPKGVYVFEYDLRVNNTGDMSNGITTIQSMYAPEFSSHSEGIRIHVD